jgi:hypothetical protein
MFDVLMAGAIYDLDWRRPGACDRQTEAIQTMATEKLRAETKAANAEARGVRLPFQCYCATLSATACSGDQ